MKMFQTLITLMMAVMALSGCADREPFTILFTSDVQGQLVPSG